MVKTSGFLGLAVMMCIGVYQFTLLTGGSGGATFDIDEASLPIAVEVLTDAICTVAHRDPLDYSEE